ncbi:hypothetical protein [Rhizobium ruizarguesonis]|uniref:hypothetical protein n=1 Tax=Rhizobium ruizarguesonis TaxID=2081791 RepID=UPI0013BB1214|nr:hypothetical protein [Rhizobium ruizarguesonis]NEH64599.1 hypothetical protein [Rhizobium ruizarguesonis]NEH78091.1 hypothetical protein [Rhizobium ruizarguesonis]NEI78522.1 hypothetical protein [Rhizobium ruizarguesonis]
MKKADRTPIVTPDSAKKTRVKRPRPEGLFLSATASAELIGVGRTTFYKKLEKFGIKPVPVMSTEHRPMYRREDILKLGEKPQGGIATNSIEPAQPAPAEPVEVEAPPIDPKKMRAVDAGFKVTPGFEHITVEEFEDSKRMVKRMKQSAHLPEFHWPPRDDD